jgi:hypothetical protein
MRSAGIDDGDDPPVDFGVMHRRERGRRHVRVRSHKAGRERRLLSCVRPAGHGPVAGARLRIDCFNEARFADGDMHEARRRIEEGHIRRACDRPDIGDFTDVAVNLDQRTVITSGIETLAPVIDVRQPLMLPGRSIGIGL